MDRLLLEIDSEMARELELVAPAKKRQRTEFVRLAIRRALDLVTDKQTREAYERKPMPEGVRTEDLGGWDPNNLFCQAKPEPKRASKRTRAKRQRRA
jgi:hypothetical protein